MAPPADDSAQLAQASDARAIRRIVVGPREAVVLPVPAHGLAVEFVPDGILIRTPGGEAFLVQGRDGADPTAAEMTLSDGSRSSIAGLLAAAVAEVEPAAGQQPAGAPGSGGQFSSLVLDQLTGIGDLGPLGFTDLPRLAPGQVDLDGDVNAAEGGLDGGSGGGGPSGPVSHPPAINPAIVPANTLEDQPSVASPVSVPVSLVPGAPGEVVTVVVSGIPAGMTFNAAGDATGLPGGSLRFTQAEAAALAITGIPADSDVDIHITFTPFSQAAGATPVPGPAQNWRLGIDAVADAPGLAVAPAAGAENTAIALPVGSTLADLDGSESLAVTISGVPSGSTLSAGTETAPGSGVFVLTPAQLAGLTITPPANFNGLVTLGVTATATESPTDFEITSANNAASVSASLVLTVTPASGIPAINPPIAPANAFEDAPTPGSPVAVPVSLVSGGPGEVATVVVSGIPAGMTFNFAGDATGLPPGALRFSQSEAAALAITGIPADRDADIQVTFTPFSQDGAAPPVPGSPQLWTLTIDAVADAPSLATAPAAGVEDNAVALSISSALADVDGSEALSVTISGVPSGAALSAGVETAPGSGIYVLTPAQLAGLSIAPPANFSGAITLGVTATATETPTDGEFDFGNNAAVTVSTLVVAIAAVADAPSLVVAPAAGDEDTAIALTIASALADTDGSETLSITIAGVPSGASLSAGTETAPGSGVFVLTQGQLAGLTLTPPPNSDVDFDLTVTATATDAGGVTASTTAPLAVAIAAVADQPDLVVAPAAGVEDNAIPLSIAAALVDVDGSETLAVTIAGVPSGAALSAGVQTAPGSGIYVLTPAQLAGLTITPPANADADFDLTVTATATDTGGVTATRVATLPVTVDAAADVPALSVSPASGVEENAIALAIAASVTDPDGSEALGAFHIAGMPPGASLSAGIDLGGGIWQVQPADVAGLTLTPPPNFNGTINLVVTATSVETPTDAETGFANNSASVSAPLVVTVAPVSDPPSLSLTPQAAGFEDLGAGNGGSPTPIAIPIAVTPGAPGETAYVVVSGIPGGVTFNAVGDATGLPAGSLRFTQAEAAALAIAGLPANGDADFTLTVAPFSQDGAAAPAPGTARTIAITIDAVADAPALTVAPAAGSEDNAIPLSIAATLVDVDGSETLGNLTISGVPSAGSLNHGVKLPSGLWVLTPAELAGLTLTPPPNFNGSIALSVAASSTETPTDVETTLLNNSASSGALVVVSVTPVSDTPTMSLGRTAVGMKEDIGTGDIAITPPAKGAAAIPITVTPGAPGETAYVIVSGVPTGVRFNSTGSTAGLPAGSIKFTQAQAAALSVTALPSNSDADFTLTVTPFSQDVGGVPPAAGAAQTIAVTVDAVADRPNLSAVNTSGNEDTAIAINLANALVDRDGSEVISGATLGNIPTGSVLKQVLGGVTTTLVPTSSGGGVDSYTLTQGQIPGLRIQTPKDFNGSVSISARLTAHENASSLPAEINVADNDASRSGTITLTVRPVSDTPGMTLGVTAVAAKEDMGAGPIAVPPPALGDVAIPVTVTPGAPGETAYIQLTGWAAGTTFNLGTAVSGSVWRVQQADAPNLRITGLPANSDVDFRLTVTPFSQDVGGATPKAGTAGTITVTVDAVADIPTLSPSASGDEDTLIPLNLTAALRDTDGSERLSGQLTLDAAFRLVTVSGSTTTTLAPSSSGGGLNTFTVSEAQLPLLRVKPPADFNGDTTLTAGLTARETATGAAEPNPGDNTASTTGTFVLTVTPVSDAPTLGAPSVVALKEDLGAASAGAGDPGTAGGFALAPPALGAVAIPLLVGPGAPGETAYVVVSGVPAGLGFNVAGTTVAPGAIQFTQAEAAALAVTAVPADSDVDIALTVTPFSQDVGSVPAASGPARTVTLTIDAVADVPNLAAPAPVAVAEDATVVAGAQRIAVPIAAALVDADGSEAAAVFITGVPAGLGLSAGSASGGVWTVPIAALATLEVIAPRHWSGGFTLGVTVNALESAAGAGEPNPADNAATRFAGVPVTVAAVADAPTLVVAGMVRGHEDSFIPLAVSAALVDGDASESLTIRLTGVPSGSTLAGGGVTLVPVSSLGGLDTYDLSAAQLAGLAVRPPLDSNLDFTVGVTAIAREASNGDVATTSATIAVDVVGVADPASLISAGTVQEGAADAAGGRVPLNILAAPTDSDVAQGRPASESVTAIVITGVPPGMSLSAGLITAVGPGGTTWSLKRTSPTTAEWDNVQLIGWQSHRAGALALGASVVTTENDGDVHRTSFASFPVTVEPVVDDFSPSASASGNEDTAIAIVVSPGLIDADGSERMTGSVTLSGVPSGVVIKSGASVLAESAPGVIVVSQAQLAGLTATPPANTNVDFALTATMTVAEFDASNDPIAGQSRTESFGFTVHVRGVADMPTATASDSVAVAGTAAPLVTGGALADTDGSERLYFMMTGVPAGAVLQLGAPAAGKLLLNLGGGTWLANQPAIGDVRMLTRGDFADPGAQTVTLALTAVSEENDGDRAAAAPLPFHVVVSAGSGGGGGGGGGGGVQPGDPGPTPTISVGVSAPGLEDHPVDLSLSLPGLPAGATAGLVIEAGSLPAGSRVISGVPFGVFVNPLNGDWIVPNAAAVLASLQIVPPPDFAGAINPLIDVVVTYADGSVGSASAAPLLTVAPVADPASVAASGAGTEDTLIKLDLAVAPTDGDGSETVTALSISGVGAGAELVDHLGNPLAQVGGVYAIADPNDVYVRPAANFHGSVALTVGAVTTDAVAGFPPSTTTVTSVVSVPVGAVADAALVAGPAVIAGVESAAIAVAAAGNVTVTPVDTDGSEVLSIVVAVLSTPPGLTAADVAFSAGVNNGDGSWTLTPAQFAALQIGLPAHAAGDLGIRVTANSFELSNGAFANAARDFTLRFEAAADAPTLSVAPASGDEDSPIPLAIVAGLVDTDGSESLSLLISGVPGGAAFSAGIDNGDGSWSLTPAQLAGLTFTGAPDAFGTLDLTVIATATETAGGTPPTASTTQTLQVSVADAVDSFAGGPGDDVLTGTAGQDVLEGKGGADALTGGAGSDRFVYAADALGAADVIADWGPTDRLDVSQLLSALAAAAGDLAPVGTDYVKVVQNGADVEVRVDQNGGQAGDTNTLLAVVTNAAAADVQSRTDFS